MPRFVVLPLSNPRSLIDVVERAFRSATTRGPLGARDLAVLVPTRAAGFELRRQLENRSAGPAFVPPDLLTRSDWLARLSRGVRGLGRRADPLARQALFEQAARHAIAEAVTPPFDIKPRILAALLDFCDRLARSGISSEDFLARAEEQLGADEGDEGAARLLRQSRFIVEVVRRYRARLAALRLSDEHTAHEALLALAKSDSEASGRDSLLRCGPIASPWRELIVTTPDAVLSEGGMWPADYALLNALEGVEVVSILAFRDRLGAGLLDRLKRAVSEFDLAPVNEESARAHGGRPGVSSQGCTLLVPAAPATAREPGSEASQGAEPRGAKGPAHFVCRDREAELALVARVIKYLRRSGRLERLDRVAIVFRRPLPYLYLAKRLFADAGIPFQAHDALPLAAESYAAALDVLLEVVASEYGRRAVLELIRSPWFDFTKKGLDSEAVAALDAYVCEIGLFGGRESWVGLPERARLAGQPAAIVATAERLARVVDEVSAIEGDQPADARVAAIGAFLKAHEVVDVRPRGPSAPGPAPGDGGGSPREAGDEVARRLRARAAVLEVLDHLRVIAREIDPVHAQGFAEFCAAARSGWEARTFAPRCGHEGVHLIDAEAALFGDFDYVCLVGLVEGDWPSAAGRDVLYPQRFLAEAGLPGERERVAAERATFRHLLRLARDRTVLVTFQLDNDTIVSASPFLEEVEGEALARDHVRTTDAIPVSIDEALGAGAFSDALLARAGPWAALRTARGARPHQAARGRAKPPPAGPYHVTGMELYLTCPYKYFARHVLGLGEEVEPDETLDPGARGLLLHRILHDFYARWDVPSVRAVTSETLEGARALVVEIADQRLREVPSGERHIERLRLCGSAAGVGQIDQFLADELEHAAEVVGRQMEFAVAGIFRLPATDPAGGAGTRSVPLRGRVDRIDIHPDDTFTIIDYKTGKPPRPATALQLPIYAACVEQALSRPERALRCAGATYLILGRDRRDRIRTGKTRMSEERVAEAALRLFRSVDGIEGGEFPPRPVDVQICRWCAFSAVCRKEYPPRATSDRP